MVPEEPGGPPANNGVFSTSNPAVRSKSNAKWQEREHMAVLQVRHVNDVVEKRGVTPTVEDECRETKHSAVVQGRRPRPELPGLCGRPQRTRRRLFWLRP